VAFWNRYVADCARGKKADDTANELPKDEFSTKARIVSAVKQSAADAARALREKSSGLAQLEASIRILRIRVLKFHLS
jgi:hypothetical protein